MRLISSRRTSTRIKSFPEWAYKTAEWQRTMEVFLHEWSCSGGAVANAVSVIQTEAMTLVDYNLDGDRGYGWKCWRPKVGTEPKSGTVDPEIVL